MGSLINLSGQRFGRLLVLSRAPDHDGRVAWYCQCDCGNKTIATSHALRSGNKQSCGCYHREVFHRMVTKHGDARKPLYNVFISMHQRCENSNCKDFYFYGKRGTKVCPEWANYPTFKIWALKAGYRKGLTIDRINPNSDYCPDNCRWITIQEQQKNRRPKRQFSRKAGVASHAPK